VPSGRQPPDFEPLVVVCDGVGLGAGGLGGGVTVGFGVGLVVVGPGAGAGWELGELRGFEPADCLVPGVPDDPGTGPCFLAPCLDDRVAE
jgi:hypothetical protein